MEYIIHPLWFYLIDVANNLRGLGGILLIICVVFTGIGAIGTFGMVENESLDDDTANGFKKFFKIIGALFIVALLMITAIPSKDSCYKMMAASIVTPNNIEITSDGVINFVDEISDVLKSSNEQSEENLEDQNDE